jgi:hypothetical protein
MRFKMWDALRFLKAQDDLPWLSAGDFNEVLAQHEHLGINQRNPNQMAAFWECLEVCGLSGLGYKGYDFTWNNRREGADNVQCRLDRGTAIASFLELFPYSCVELITTEESDHLALLIKVREAETARPFAPSWGFKFEEMWLKHEGFDDMIKSAWENHRGGQWGIDTL